MDSHEKLEKHSKQHILFFLFIFVFMAIISSIALEQFESKLQKDYQHNLDLKSKLIGSLTTESYLRSDFASIEASLFNWGIKNPDVVEILLLTPENFKLVHYKRQKTGKYLSTNKNKITFQGKTLFTLYLTMDTSKLHDSISKLQSNVIIFAFLFTAILGFVLWSVFKSIAIKPLEKEIDERKLKENELSLSQARFVTVMDSIDANVFVSDNDFNIIFANKSFIQNFGNINNKKCYEALMTTNPPCENCERNQFIGFSSPGHEEFQDINTNKWYRIKSQLIQWVDGKLVQLEILSDITEQKEVQEYLEEKVNERTLELLEINKRLKDEIVERQNVQKSLAESNSYLNSVINNASNAIIVINPKNQIEFISQKGIELLNQPLQELRKLFFYELFIGEQQVLVKKHLDAIYKEKEAVLNLELEIDQNNKVYVLLNLDPLIVNGRIFNIVASLLNITVQKNHEAELNAINRELKRSNKELEEFAYIASHDLIEPLRKIEFFSHSLHNKYSKNLDEKGKDFLNRIEKSSKKMKMFIHDLLSYSKVSKSREKPTKLDLNKVLNNVLTILELTIEQSDAIIDYTNLPTIEADEILLQQLFQNLISNSIKFGDRDRQIRIDISYSSLTPEEKRARNLAATITYYEISFRDNGIGIDDRYRDKIFNIFQRAHSKKKYEGSGIGLAICRKIMEYHNGIITVESTPGKGSHFKIILPKNQIYFQQHGYQTNYKGEQNVQ